MLWPGIHPVAAADDADETEEIVREIERERCTGFGGVPAMVWQVLESPRFKDHALSSVKSVSYGGAPAAPELVRRIKQEFPGGSPTNGYGLTETSPVVTANTKSGRRLGSDLYCLHGRLSGLEEPDGA